MFSPAKAITVGAIVFAIGGVLLVAQPFGQQTSVPGAEVADQTTHYVYGTMLHDYSVDSEEETTYPDGIDERLRSRLHGRVETQDARMTGDVTYDSTIDFLPVPDRPDDPAELGWSDVTIETDGGRWEGPVRCVPVPPFLRTEGDNPCFYALTGTDGYEGLSAMLTLTDVIAGEVENEDIETYRLAGLIFVGNLPPDR